MFVLGATCRGADKKHRRGPNAAWPARPPDESRLTHPRAVASTFCMRALTTAPHDIAVEPSSVFVAQSPYDRGMSSLDSKRDALLASICRLDSCAVAFSGGVDSAVVAKAARLALGDRAVAVTGTSASLAGGELEAAEELAALIGIRHVVIATDELASPDYARNAPDRCFHCKTELYTQLE